MREKLEEEEKEGERVLLTNSRSWMENLEECQSHRNLGPYYSITKWHCNFSFSFFF